MGTHQDRGDHNQGNKQPDRRSIQQSICKKMVDNRRIRLYLCNFSAPYAHLLEIFGPLE